MSSSFKTISTCEVCGNHSLISVLDLGLHPMCDDLVPVGDSRICEEYPIDILFCSNCFTAHQHHQVPKLDLFPASYHYRSRFTADVLSGMQDMVQSCIETFGELTDKKVLDIGCNDGSLLDFFSKVGADTFGIEPTAAAGDCKLKGHITYQDYLSPAIAKSFVDTHGYPDFITFTNVFAHIDDLDDVILSLNTLLGPSTVIVIENHYLGSVLKGHQFDTFYHEHPRTYSFNSFKYIAQSLKLVILNLQFPSRYGGNIRVFLGPSNFSVANFLIPDETYFHSTFIEMNSNIQLWRDRMTHLISDLVCKHGPLNAKAFPGRSAILVKLLNLDINSVSAVYEKPGSLKIGHYVPGTRIPILSDNELISNEDLSKPLLNFAWHIPTEISLYMTNLSYTGPIIDILSKDYLAS